MEQLSGAQTILLASLLQGKKLVDAAKDAGVAYSTAKNWRNSEPFLLAYEAACDEVIGAAINQVSNTLEMALDTMAELAQGARSEGVRLRAASALVNSYRDIADAHSIQTKLNELKTALKLER